MGTTGKKGDLHFNTSVARGNDILDRRIYRKGSDQKTRSIHVGSLVERERRQCSLNRDSQRAAEPRTLLSPSEILNAMLVICRKIFFLDFSIKEI